MDFLPFFKASSLPHTSLQTLWSYNVIAEECAQETAEPSSENEIVEFASYLPYKARILDIGSGPGIDARILCELGLEVIGIDFSPNMIKIAKQIAPLASFHLMAIENMDFPSESFDGIWTNCSLVHIPKTSITSVLQNIYKLLKSNGVLYLSVKKGKGERLKKELCYNENYPQFWAYYSKSEINKLLNHVNFKVLAIKKSCNKEYATEPLIHVFAAKRKSFL